MFLLSLDLWKFVESNSSDEEEDEEEAEPAETTTGRIRAFGFIGRSIPREFKSILHGIAIGDASSAWTALTTHFEKNTIHEMSRLDKELNELSIDDFKTVDLLISKIDQTCLRLLDMKFEVSDDRKVLTILNSMLNQKGKKDFAQVVEQITTTSTIRQVQGQPRINCEHCIL